MCFIVSMEFKLSILVTDIAVSQIKKSLDSRGTGAGIRIGLKTTGCSGMAYTIEYADDVRDDDISHEFGGIVVVFSKKDARYLDGIELDYSRKGLNEGFEFINPNEKNRCGCGESFTA